MEKDLITEVGFFSWATRSLKRQFYKWVIHKDNRMLLPSGEQLLLPYKSYYATEIFTSKANIDWGSEALLFKLLQKKGFLLDIGAGIGYYSLYMLKKIKGVYSFEEDSSLLKQLRKAVAGRDNIHVISTLENSIDEFVRERKVLVEAIKIDVKEKLLQLIDGAKDTLNTHRPIVLAIASPTLQLFQLLKGTDYSVFGYVRDSETREKFFLEILPGVQGNYSYKAIFLVPAEQREAVRELAERQSSVL